MSIQPCSLGGIEFDALVNESKAYTSEVPSYAVESGYSVSDNISILPLAVEATVYLTNTPVTWLSQHGTGRVEGIVAALEGLYFSRELVTFRTSTDSYPNMSIVSLTVPKDETNKGSREIKISLKQVNIVSAQTTSIPATYSRGGATGQNAGTAGTGKSESGGSGSSGNSESENKSSILYGLLN